MKKLFLLCLAVTPKLFFAQINPYMNTIQNAGFQNSSLGGYNQILGTGTSYQITAGCFISGYGNMIKYSTVSTSPVSNSSHVFGDHSVAGGIASFAIGSRIMAGTDDYNTGTASSSTTFYSNSIGIGKDIKVYAENAMAIGSGLYSSNHSQDLINTTPSSLVIGFNNTSTTRPTFFLVEPNTANASAYDDYGSIGIGTNDTKGHTLGVRGDIIAEKMQVALYASWPDYVFEKNYQLTPLEGVEQYISENKHLPNVPDALSIQKNGYDMAEMDAILLKKIEELTLYVIQLNKENQEIKKQLVQTQK